MKDKDTIIKGLISLVVVVLIGAATYFIVSPGGKENAKNTPIIQSSSKIVSSDPELTASLFIKAAGTMGNIENEVDGDRLMRSVVLKGNRLRRSGSYELAKAALVPGSPLFINENFLGEYSDRLSVPVFYIADNVKTSKPTNSRVIDVVGKDAVAEFNAVDVLVSFDSTRIIYDRERDVTWDGTYDQVGNKEEYKDIKVTLVQSGDLWFVYDIEDAEYTLNARLSTWKGTGVETIDASKNKVIGTVKVEGFKPYTGGN